jgi:hypothetical protein
MTYIVCGWYTPDYANWWGRLRPTLEAVDAPHDFVQVEKHNTHWEKQTLRKAGQVRDAMLRHPGKTIIFLDVDCTVHGSLEPLAEIAGEFGICSTVKYHRTRRHSIATLITTRSGTLVLKPREACYDLVKTWVDMCEKAPDYVHDQQVLSLAMTKVPGLTVTNLGVKWCAVERDEEPTAIIRHDHASKGSHATKWQRRLAYIKNRWAVAA